MTLGICIILSAGGLIGFIEVRFWIYFLLAFGVFSFLPFFLRARFLLGVSYFFYATWNPIFLSLILFSTIVDFYCGEFAHPDKELTILRRKMVVGISLSMNLGLLAFFKYFNFFIEDLVRLLGMADSSTSQYVLGIGVPIGISFYTFQTLSYTIDCYRGELKPIKKFSTFALYVSFFPQLLAGPIERARFLIPQLERNLKFSLANLKVAGLVIVWGIFKKLFIADNLYPIVKTIFAQPELNIYEVIWGSFLTTVVVYCDFSAYSDIALGLARLLNIKLMKNFKPFLFVKSPDQFWKVWHVSLTTWIRDYVYRSIRKSSLKIIPIVIQVLFVSLLIGFWHGPQWTWGAWGISVAVYFLIFRLIANIIPRNFGGDMFRYLFMFCMYCTLGFWHEMRFVETAKLGNISLSFYLETFTLIWESFFFIIPLLVLEYFFQKDNTLSPLEKIPSGAKPIILGILLCLIFWYPPSKSYSFVYFEF